jgi:hypothetical protein
MEVTIHYIPNVDESTKKEDVDCFDPSDTCFEYLKTSFKNYKSKPKTPAFYKRYYEINEFVNFCNLVKINCPIYVESYYKDKSGTVYRVYDEDYRTESDRLFDRVDDEKLKQFLFNFEKQAAEVEQKEAIEADKKRTAEREEICNEHNKKLAEMRKFIVDNKLVRMDCPNLREHYYKNNKTKAIYEVYNGFDKSTQFVVSQEKGYKLIEDEELKEKILQSEIRPWWSYLGIEFYESETVYDRDNRLKEETKK